MKASSARGEKLEVNLTPLLDLVLQLIMFFMITVNFVRTERVNDEVRLPIVQSATPLDRSADNWVFLNMNRDGKILVSSDERLDSTARLRAHLQREKESIDRAARERGIKELKTFIVLRVDKDAHYRDVWEVLDICSRAGYAGWQMRVIRQLK
jgi:biopolymer transport protein ExbD